METKYHGDEFNGQVQPFPEKISKLVEAQNNADKLCASKIWRGPINPEDFNGDCGEDAVTEDFNGDCGEDGFVGEYPGDEFKFEIPLDEYPWDEFNGEVKPFPEIEVDENNHFLF
jgi:hypothetical protein